MKRNSFFILCILLSLSNSVAQWTPDVLGEGFEQQIIKMPDDYEGAVNCALVRSLPDDSVHKAVLYIHGFNDYFYQKEQAIRYNEHGYAFYAVDLRKNGRACLPNQKHGNVRDLKEYYPDIDTCLNIMQEKGYTTIILAAHSTGGLIAGMYANDLRDNLPINGMVLNSPFLDMNFGKFKEKIGVPLVSALGAVFPNIRINSGNDDFYARSLHKNYSGEWDYNLDWKPPMSIPVNFGWTRAIHKGHKNVKKGMNIPCPILVMHSDKSVYGKEFSEDFMTGDAILSVDDIHKYALHLGKNVTIAVIKDGMHDLVLSAKDVREEVYTIIFAWLEEEGL